MGFHNPFLKDGQLQVSRQRKRGPSRREVGEGPRRQARLPLPRLLHRARRRRARSELGASSASATAPSPPGCSRSPQPGDRVAILCPQNLEYIVAFFGTLYAGPHRGAAVRPVRARSRRPPARRARRLPADRDPDHHRRRRGRAEVLPQPARQGTPTRHRGRRGARRGRRHLGARRRQRRHHRLPAVHLRFDAHPDRRADHPPQPGHQRRAGHRGARRRGGRPRRHRGCRSSTTWV